MKRICLLGAAIAGLFLFAVTAAFAASTAGKSTSGSKSKSTTKSSGKVAGPKVTCTLQLTSQAQPGTNGVTAGAPTGSHFGTVRCAKMLGTGVQHGQFDTAVSGNVTGKYQQWFNTGSIYGQYTLVPNPTGPPTTTNFAAASYTGTITVKNGTGAYTHSTGKGTIKCTTNDSVHYACKETLHLVVPGAAS